MSDQKRIIDIGWGKEFIGRWLDDNSLPRIDVIEARGWGVVPVADIMTAMEAEWLGEAISDQSTAAVALAFEFKGQPESSAVNPERDELLQFNSANSYRYVIITSYSEEFLYFKDEANRFFLLCGNDRFLRSAYRCTRETARIMYFDQGVERDTNSEAEKAFLLRIWNTYDRISSG
jgi:hypothetical protein